MSPTQLSKIWWFLASVAIFLLLLGFKDSVGWMEQTKFFDDQNVPEVISFWSLITGGLCLTGANLVGGLYALRSSEFIFFDRIPDWPLTILEKTNAEDETRWDWKLFKLIGLLISTLFPFIISNFHFYILTRSKVYLSEGHLVDNFFTLTANGFDDLRIGKPNGDQYFYLWTPFLVILVQVFIFLSIMFFVFASLGKPDLKK